MESNLRDETRRQPLDRQIAGQQVLFAANSSSAGSPRDQPPPANVSSQTTNQGPTLNRPSHKKHTYQNVPFPVESLNQVPDVRAKFDSPAQNDILPQTNHPSSVAAQPQWHAQTEPHSPSRSTSKAAVNGCSVVVNDFYDVPVVSSTTSAREQHPPGQFRSQMSSSSPRIQRSLHVQPSDMSK